MDRPQFAFRFVEGRGNRLWLADITTDRMGPRPESRNLHRAILRALQIASHDSDLRAALCKGFRHRKTHARSAAGHEHGLTRENVRGIGRAVERRWGGDNMVFGYGQ